MKKLLAVIAALGLLCSLAACNNAPASSAGPTADPTPAVDQGIAGTYHFEYVDKYGDATRFSVLLRSDGTFTIMTSLGALGDNLCSGTEWTDNGDGTFTTGATDNVLELDFVAADGTVTWTILDDDGTVVPVGYVEPTEFEEKPVEDDGGVASGVYTYKENNGFMDIEWTLLLRADGVYELNENGRDTYVGPYTIDGTTVICGAMTDVKPQLYDWCSPEGFTLITGATTFVPDYEGRTLEGEEPAAPVPQGTASAAPTVYTLKENNGYMDIEWELELRDDGSYALTEVGRDTYVGESYTQDGSTVVCGPMLNAPLMFTWANPEGFTVTIDGSTFAPVE